MRLTHYSDYALRSLIYLATKPDPSELSNISDIADSYNISKSHLTKIIHQLSKLGVVESVRGKHGGIRLGMPPENINIGALVRETECDFKIVDCFYEQPLRRKSDDTDDQDDIVRMINTLEMGKSCVISPSCQLKWVLGRAMQAFIEVLDDYTLADIITNQDEIGKILHIR